MEEAEVVQDKAVVQAVQAAEEDLILVVAMVDLLLNQVNQEIQELMDLEMQDLKEVLILCFQQMPEVAAEEQEVFLQVKMEVL